MTHFLKTSAVAACALAAAMIAPSAQAGGDTALVTWANGASQAIDEVMVYPSHLASRNREANYTYRVTVDADGDVVSYKRTAKKGSSAFSLAAEKVIETADWPALSADMDRDSLTFAVQLNYETVTNYRDYQKRMQSPNVTTRQLAGAGRIRSASIEILDSAE